MCLSSIHYSIKLTTRLKRSKQMPPRKVSNNKSQTEISCVELTDSTCNGWAQRASATPASWSAYRGSESPPSNGRSKSKCRSSHRGCHCEWDLTAWRSWWASTTLTLPDRTNGSSLSQTRISGAIISISVRNCSLKAISQSCLSLQLSRSATSSTLPKDTKFYQKAWKEGNWPTKEEIKKRTLESA